MTNQLLDKCLQQMASGVSLEACLAAHPDQRMELEPLLRTAALLRSARQVNAPTSYKQATRTRLLNQIESQQRMAAPAPAPSRAWWDGLIDTLKRLLAAPSLAAAMIIALVLMLGVFATTTVAQSALPGDVLYPVKLWEEGLQVRLSDDPVQLQLAFAERRLQESLALQNQQRYEAVPDALLRYRQQLDNWTPLAQAQGVLQQEQIQQRLRRQVQLLDALEQAAPMQQQTMMRETHRWVEQLIHKSGSESGHGGPPAVAPSATPDAHAPIMAPRHGTVTPARHKETPAGEKTPVRTGQPMQATTFPGDDPIRMPRPQATPHRQPDDPQGGMSPTGPGHHGADAPTPTPFDDSPPATPTPAVTEAPLPANTPHHGEATPTAWPGSHDGPQHTPTMEHDDHGMSQPPHTPQPTQESDGKGKKK